METTNKTKLKPGMTCKINNNANTPQLRGIKIKLTKPDKSEGKNWWFTFLENVINENGNIDEEKGDNGLLEEFKITPLFDARELHNKLRNKNKPEAITIIKEAIQKWNN